MRHWLGRCVYAIVLTAGVAAAQTVATTEAFDQLSPGNQQIAQALFEAQLTSRPPGSAPTLTLDDIAAQHQSGQGWGHVFKQMQAQGLVQEKNLGQVISTYTHQPRPAAPSAEVVITTGSGRTEVVGGTGKSTGSVAAGKGVKGSHGHAAGHGASGAGVGKSGHRGGRAK